MKDIKNNPEYDWNYFYISKNLKSTEDFIVLICIRSS